MDYKKMLTETFGDVIISAKLTDTFGKTLEVVVDYRDLNKVEEISKKISTYLDEQEWFSDEYFLEVLSKGEDIEIAVDNIQMFINETVKVNLIKPFSGHDTLIVKVLEDQEAQIMFQWNQKGRIRKILIDKENISKIEKYIKF
ncbi:ribosome assembly cofactor RimP [Mycoplasmopsis edwardii]|uniref:Ribosome assembly cofactor RimP n=1 Tax=Mycoplasmopsis edwardii TaxID=53558 RepID=A0ACD4PHH2_9BACT|nr:ribosome assembly cofactor RimP [Mycoplasmopsis edwardii]WBP84119.1 ribosome assembly cofactor RimP [Mycoplasmopsis edwardii]